MNWPPGKVCRQCNLFLDIEKFHSTIATRKSGKRVLIKKSYCKDCCSIQRKKYHAENKEKSLKKQEQWRNSNREHINKYAREMIKIPSVKAKRAERERLRAAKIRLSELTLTEWERKQTDFIYRASAAISIISGIKYHVDHRYPLSKGGKHHPSNLQILTAIDNIKKKDKIL